MFRFPLNSSTLNPFSYFNIVFFDGWNQIVRHGYATVVVSQAICVRSWAAQYSFIYSKKISIPFSAYIMKAFETNQWIFARLSLCTAPTAVNRKTKLQYELFGLAIFLTLAVSATSSSILIFEKFKSDLVSSLFAVFQLMGALCAIVPMTIAFLCQLQVAEIFSNFHRIHGNFCFKKMSDFVY